MTRDGTKCQYGLKHLTEISWLAGVSGLTDLQGEKESLPFLAPEVRQNGSGCDGECQCHHNASLTQTQEDKKNIIY